MQVDDYEKMTQLSQTNVILLIEYEVLSIMYFEIKTAHFFRI